jgi:hypothetical protein
MTENKYAPSAWGAKSAFVDLTVPSGQLCQVRQPGVENLIAAGVLDNADTLIGLVNQKVEKAKGKTPAAKKAQVDPTEVFKQDPKKLTSLFAMIDKIVEHMVIQPKVVRPVVKLDEDPAKPGTFAERPMLPEERDENTVYTDSIELADRMFLFQYAIGGGDDVDSFREKFATSLGGLAAQ